MTVTEMTNLANNGDVKAMSALGEYYTKNKHTYEAWKWYTMAAENGHTPSIVYAALSGKIIAIALVKGASDIEGAIEAYEKTVKYSDLSLKSAEVPQVTKKSIADQLPSILFRLGYFLFMKGRFETAEHYMQHPAVQKDPACRLILGLCYFDRSLMEKNTKLIQQAVPLLKAVEQTTLAEYKYDDIEYMAFLNYMAYTNLAHIYRIPDAFELRSIKSNVVAAREYVVKSIPFGDKFDADLGDTARKELQKYKKGFFGGYSYIE